MGGLAVGEHQSDMLKILNETTDYLPKFKPRYLMGVGYQVELVVCSALGCDMYDCVFPTRTARFGSALVRTGQLQLKNKQFANDDAAIDKDCSCFTCKTYSRAYLHFLLNEDTTGVILLTIHNISYQLRLMSDIRNSIMQDSFPDFIRNFFSTMFPDKNYPSWAVDALSSVGVILSN
jgi:queuine tRNA-ribosyltransferase